MLVNYPSALHLGRRLPADSPDALAQGWSMAWAGHALASAPSELFQGNVFWPESDALARTDSLVGYGPLTWLAGGQHGLTLVYGLVWLFSQALAWAGAFLLARELGAPRGGAVVAGFAFACAPWRLSQVNHLHLLSSGGIPLSLYFLLRGYRRRDWRLILAGYATASWQVTLGWALGLQLLYLLAAVGFAAAVVVVRRRPEVPAGVRAATLAGVLCLVLTSGAMALPYVRTLAESSQPPAVAAHHFSAPIRGLLVAPRRSVLWGYRSVSLRDSLPVPDEQSLFPGLAISALALAGASIGPFARRTRRVLAASAIVAIVLALGYGLLDGWLGYRELAWLPGWQGVRVPGRLMTLATLALALLAAGGATALTRWLVRKRPRVPAAAVAGGCALVVAAEGFGPLHGAAVRPAPSYLATVPRPILHLPARFYTNQIYMFWSAAAGFPPTVNGQATTVPEANRSTYRAVEGFPDRRSVVYLRTLGVRTVALHPWLGVLTPWEHAAQRPVRGLGIVRRRVGSDILYELWPGSGAFRRRQ